jgi:vitamin B12 transporter
MKILAWFACLPFAAAAPVWGQDCDAECEAALEYEKSQGTFDSKEEAPDVAAEVDFSHRPIYVEGTLPPPLSDATYKIADVEQIGNVSERLESALLKVPSMQQFRRSDARSANPTSQGVTLRGLGGNASSRALLVLDDVPQADPFGGWVSWPGYDALELRSVRVRSGAGHPGFGPGALAGIIELNSFQAGKQARATASYGSRNSLDVRALYATPLGNGSINSGFTYARGDGFIPIISSQRGAVDTSAKYEQAGLALRGVAPLSEQLELQASLRAFTDRRNRGLAFSDNSNGGADASLRLVQRYSRWQWSATAYAQLREFSSQFGAVPTDRSVVTPTLDQFATPSTGNGLRFEVRPPLGEAVELRLGSEWRRTNAITKERFTFVAGVPTRLRSAGGETDSYGGFGEASLKVGDNFTLSTGGRLDRWQIDNGFRREINIGGSVRSDERFVDRSGSEWTWRGGFGWDDGSGLTFKGSAYRGWRLPTLNELYRPFRVGSDATAANEALKPERVEGGETTFAYQGFNGDLDFDISATAFYNRLSNAIANVTLGQGVGIFPGVGFVAAGGTYRQRQNLDAIVSKGIELSASLRFGADVRIAVGYAFVDAKVRGNGVALPLSGLRPAQVPLHSGNASVVWWVKNSSAAVTLRYIGRQFEDDANSRVLDDALTVDLSLGYALTKKLELQLRGENLFDARIEAAISSAGIIERATPRTIWFGVRWNFD